MFRFVCIAAATALLSLALGDAAGAQDIRPLPPVETPQAARVMYDPSVAPVGVVEAVPDGPVLLQPPPKHEPAALPTPKPMPKPAAAAAGSASVGTSSAAEQHGLTEADVQRIVADYLAKLAQAPDAVPAAAEANVDTNAEATVAQPLVPPPPPLPIPADTLPAPPEPQWYPVGTDRRMTAQWINGLVFQSPNQDFQIHLGGQTQFDTTFFSGDDALEAPQALGGVGPVHDSMEFRRARLRVDGLMYEQIEFAVEYEFLNTNTVDITQTPPLANTVPAATDLWVNFTKLPILGNVKVGNQKDPIGFEHMENGRFLDFMERSFNQDLFYGPFNNGFAPGITASDMVFDGLGTWAAGAFGANMNANTNLFGYSTGSDYAYVFRGTMLPCWDQDGRYLLHLGASYEHRDSDDGRVRVRTRGNIRNGPPGPFNAVYADTTSLQADSQDLLNFEFVYQWGSFLFQSEWCFTNINGATQITGVPAPSTRGTVAVNGGYMEMLYFLTGEHRAYDQRAATFGRVIPNQNSFRVLGRNGCICQGPGAWQIGIRYDRADLNDNGINGGMLNAMTLGVNWFLNPNMKVQFNWDWTHRGQVARFDPAVGANNVVVPGDMFGFGTRLAIDF